ncbi:DUF4855 domain-containing protein [Paenibacillus sp. UNC217MF]|uniref:DUF4855 domain-containing protein n=1 Tax=Paenibacillus sp. UNC217MF TaxID=1449062 RepID=UPI000AB2D959|nr:DUF4855 domain-containing protein [Paenibacillus sp. UNC217MF]
MKKKMTALVLSMMLVLSIIPNMPNAQAAPQLSNLAPSSTYTWSEAPESNYPDPGNKLTNGVKGAANVTDPAWVGHIKKKAREVTFDLGQRKSIASVKAHFLQDWPGSAILFPLSVSIYVSDDSINWGIVGHKATERGWTNGPPIDQTYVWNGSKDGVAGGGQGATMAYARYVKVVFSMHPRAWTFIDEIEIMGTDGKADGAVVVNMKPFEFQYPGVDTAGIRNLSLVYNGYYPDVPAWTKDSLIPEIGYVNQAGQVQDWFFDGVLMLGLQSPAGRDFGNNSLLTDWQWYLDKTFGAQGDLKQLNEATKEVGIQLGQPNHKTKVVIMLPNPGETTTNFGDIDGDGITENFSEASVGIEKALATRQKAVRWWLQEVQNRWNANNYSNLELVGMYWVDEEISWSKSAPDFLRMMNSDVHARGLKSFWIPHSLTYKSFIWKDAGFDAATYQPNYFFEDLSIDRLVDGIQTAKRYGMGVEVEFDNRMLTDNMFRNRFNDYMNAGYQYGFAGKGFTAYYKGSGPVLRDAANSTNPSIRALYDRLYNFTRGN